MSCAVLCRAAFCHAVRRGARFGLPCIHAGTLWAWDLPTVLGWEHSPASAACHGGAAGGAGGAGASDTGIGAGAVAAAATATTTTTFPGWWHVLDQEGWEGVQQRWEQHGEDQREWEQRPRAQPPTASPPAAASPPCKPDGAAPPRRTNGGVGGDGVTTAEAVSGGTSPRYPEEGGPGANTCSQDGGGDVESQVPGGAGTVGVGPGPVCLGAVLPCGDGSLLPAVHLVGGAGATTWVCIGGGNAADDAAGVLCAGLVRRHGVASSDHT